MMIIINININIINIIIIIIMIITIPWIEMIHLPFSQGLEWRSFSLLQPSIRFHKKWQHPSLSRAPNPW